MKRPLLNDDNVRALWRIDVNETERLCCFEVEMGGHTHALSAVATRTLRDALTELLEAADRFATQEEARAAQDP